MPWGSAPVWPRPLARLPGSALRLMAPSYSQPALRAMRMASMRLRPPTLAMALER